MRISVRLSGLALILTLHVACADVVGAVQFAVAGQKVQFTEESFDKSNFNQMTAVTARRRCQDSLDAALALVEKATELSDAQKTKLTLAGNLDIHRFFCSYQGCKQGLKFGEIPRNQWQAQFAAARRNVLPLKTQYSEGLHGDSSLFAKTMRTALDESQNKSVQAMFRERARTRYKNYIRMALAIIDRKVPLSVAQRTTITELLLADTEPPASFGTSSAPVFIVFARMGQIQDELGEILTESEMDVIRQLIQAGKMAVAQQEAFQ